MTLNLAQGSSATPETQLKEADHSDRHECMNEPRKKRGRPVKAEGTARTIVKQFRVNDIEDAAIEEQAANAGYSSFPDYAREELAKRQRRKLKPRKSEIDDRILFELNRGFVNLHQLVKHLNYGGSIPNDIVEVIEDIEVAVAKVSAAYDT